MQFHIERGRFFNCGSFRALLRITLSFLIIKGTCAAQDRFGLDSAHVKGTNNYGKGDSALWGSRNMRVVLKNVLYRGGGNNFHLKESQPKTFVRNPLPLEGVRQLHQTGFGSSWYLYATNFDSLYPPQRLDSLHLAGFEYECHPSLTDEVVNDFMECMHQLIASPRPRPMYIHCWNGWHQSGMLSAFTLIQFCGLSNQQALKYWEQNTDGNYHGYAAVKSRILEYSPNPSFEISDPLQALICPCFTNDVLNAKGKSVKEVRQEGEGGAKQNMETKSGQSDKKTIRIKKGDTLSAIAQRNNTTVKKLCTLNGIKETKVLQIGERIRIR
ncbi:MAG: LysM peptidoglycan-binding domain-containing protein [Flavobacteriales bacterium]